MIEIFSKSLKEKKKRGVVLPVSAPFHCSLMQKASEDMKIKINETNFLKPAPKFVSNVTATEEEDVSKIKLLLVDQITSRVRWRESMLFMIENGVENFIEIGPGKVLSGLLRKINKDLKVFNINSVDDITNYINK